MIHSPKNPIISHKIQPTPCLQRLKRSTVPADNSLMGQVVKLPNCREISPEVFRLIVRRTKNASHWVRYWSAYWSTANELIGEIDPDGESLGRPCFHAFILGSDEPSVLFQFVPPASTGGSPPVDPPSASSRSPWRSFRAFDAPNNTEAPGP